MADTVFLLIFSSVLGFLFVFLYRKVNENRRIAIGMDINKPSLPEISEGTGIALLPALWLSVLALFLHTQSIAPIAWGLLASIFSVIGFLDDMKPKFVKPFLGWKVRAVPIAVASLGFAFFFAPSILWVVPLALFVAGIASFQNTFAGLNGWQAGSGLIIASFTLLLMQGTILYGMAVILAGLIVAFLAWNIYPAKALEGDAGTLFFGSGIAGLAVLNGNPLHFFLVFLFFLPHMVDFFALKLLTNAKDASQSKTRPYKILSDGRIGMPDSASGYDFAKLLIRVFGPMKEWKIVSLIWAVVFLNCAFWFSVFMLFLG